MKKTRDDQQPQQQPQLLPYYHLSRKIHMTPWSWQGQEFGPHRTQCHADPWPRRRDPGSSADGADGATGVGCRISTVDRCLCMEQRARGDLNEWPGQRSSHSIGPQWSERRWKRHWEHPENRCSLRLGDSVLDRLPRSAYFRPLTSSQLSYLILQVLWKQPLRKRKRTMLFFRTVATHFLDASVGVLPISTLLGPDAQWSTKDIGQSPRHPLGCRAPRTRTERVITT